MKWLKKLFKKLSSKSISKTALRDKVVEMYGEEAGGPVRHMIKLTQGYL